MQQAILEIVTSQSFLDLVIMVACACTGGGAVIAKYRPVIRAAQYLASQLLQQETQPEIPAEHKKAISKLVKSAPSSSPQQQGAA